MDPFICRLPFKLTLEATTHGVGKYPYIRDHYVFMVLFFTVSCFILLVYILFILLDDDDDTYIPT